MNMMQTLLKAHSRAVFDEVVEYIGNDPKRFAKLAELFISQNYRVTQRAAWPLSYCIEVHPSLIKPHLRRIIKHLKTPGIHVAVKRNTVRFLQFIEIPKALQGEVADTCFSFLSNPKETIAVRVFSMTVLFHIASQVPGIGNELRVILEGQLPYGSAGFASRARKILSALAKLDAAVERKR